MMFVLLVIGVVAIGVTGYALERRDAFNDGIKENIERLAEETEMATHE